MTKRYDTTFIIDGTLSVDDREAVIKTFSGSLEKHGGEIEQIIRWGTRTLTHEINKRNRGFYVIFYFSVDPSIIKTFERELRINENILRYMTLIFDGTNPTYIVDERVKTESSYSSNKVAANVVEETEEIEAETDETDADIDDTDADTDETVADIDDTDAEADVDLSADAEDNEDVEVEKTDQPEAEAESVESDVPENEPVESESTPSDNEDIAADEDSDKEDKE